MDLTKNGCTRPFKKKKKKYMVWFGSEYVVGDCSTRSCIAQFARKNLSKYVFQ